MSIKDAARFIGVTQNTLRNWEREKKISVLRNPLNKYRLFKKEDLELLLKSIDTNEWQEYSEKNKLGRYE